MSVHGAAHSARAVTNLTILQNNNASNVVGVFTYQGWRVERAETAIIVDPPACGALRRIPVVGIPHSNTMQRSYPQMPTRRSLRSPRMESISTSPRRTHELNKRGQQWVHAKGLVVTERPGAGGTGGTGQPTEETTDAEAILPPEMYTVDEHALNTRAVNTLASLRELVQHLEGSKNSMRSDSQGRSTRSEGYVT